MVGVKDIGLEIEPPLREKPRFKYICPCGKAFRTKKGLVIHQRKTGCDILYNVVKKEELASTEMANGLLKIVRKWRKSGLSKKYLIDLVTKYLEEI